MPARDPAASPHLPNLSSSHATPPTWLNQGRRGSAPLSGSVTTSEGRSKNPSGSGFSLAGGGVGGVTEGSDDHNRKAGGGVGGGSLGFSIGKGGKRGMWSSLSSSTTNEMEGTSTKMDIENQHQGGEPSHSAHLVVNDSENTERNPHRSSFSSTDREAIRDSSSRLAMSFTSDQSSSSDRDNLGPRNRPPLTSLNSEAVVLDTVVDSEDEDEDDDSGRKVNGSRNGNEKGKGSKSGTTTPVGNGAKGSILSTNTTPPSQVTSSTTTHMSPSAPTSRIPSPQSGPSGISVLMERQRRSQQDLQSLMVDGQGKHSNKEKSKGKGKTLGTEELASGANGLVGIGLLGSPSGAGASGGSLRRGSEDTNHSGSGSGPNSTEATPRPLGLLRLDSDSSGDSSTATTRPNGNTNGNGKGKDQDSVSGSIGTESGQAPPKVDIMEPIEESPDRNNERTPLLPKSKAKAKPTHKSKDKDEPSQLLPSTAAASESKSGPSQSPITSSSLIHRTQTTLSSNWKSIKKATWQDIARETLIKPVQTIPATILGTLLNVLDGVSYGMIMFPASPVFAGFGSIGVSMFFVSCIISQLTYTLGGSIFRGGNGSMMIEVVPFFHILTNKITDELGESNATAIIATTMVSYAFSAILTGLVFMLLGLLKLGGLIGYFPRHILVGCIGGVGVFLLVTGFEVSRGLKEEGVEYNLATLKIFFESGHAIALWTIPLALAIMLRMITHRFTHQLIFPAYFFIIPCIFYIVVAIGPWGLADMRRDGWIFDVGQESQPWYTFYQYFDFKQTSWSAFWACIPTQLALVFFGILHVPLNVPALGVSLQEDNVDLDRELIGHGISNMASGFLGSVPNYLCYVNTVLFYRVGGGSVLSGLMLASSTAVVMLIGPSVIGYLPVMVVGALIFVLGIDLVKEAVWDTRHRVNKMEYVTIWAITIGMTVFDFVIGLLIGIIMASMFFVVQNSRRRPIRAILKGTNAKSTVRRPQAQRAFIQAVGKQTVILKLQGFLFFGTITKVEDEIRKLLDVAEWEHSPVRFIICDFTLVGGLDFSSAEAFVRVQRLLSQKDVLLIFCGADPEGLVGKALQAVDLWADMEGTRVEVFDGLNSALEWCENAYLTAFYASSTAKKESAPRAALDFPHVQQPPFAMSESYQNSPRRRHLEEVGVDTLPSFETPSAGSRTTANPVPSTGSENPTESKTPAQAHRSTSPLALKQPLPVLLQTFSAYTDLRHDFFHQLASYFVLVEAKKGTVLWHQDDSPDGLYLIESGCLRANYQYDSSNNAEMLQETMVAGTVAGELSMLSGAKRNATVLVERDARLWKMDNEGLERLEKEKGEVARVFVKMVLKVAATEWDDLSSHLIAVLS